jgi:hypothetical protein
MRDKEGCSRERDLREIFSENTKMLSFVIFLCFCFHITEYKQMGGGDGAKFSWAQGRKIPKYGPGYISGQTLSRALSILRDVAYVPPCLCWDNRYNLLPSSLVSDNSLFADQF